MTLKWLSKCSQKGPGATSSAALAPPPAEHLLVGNRRFSNRGEAGQQALHQALMRTGLKHLFLRQLMLLKDTDKKEWRSKGLFITDPTTNSDYTAKVSHKDAVWIERLEAVIQSEHPCNLVESVARMFANAHTVYQGNAEAEAHVARCRDLWQGSMCPVVEKAQVAWGERQHETEEGCCALCKRLNVELPVVNLPCDECGNLVGSGESECYAFVSHTERAALCATCGVRSRGTYLNKDQWIIQDQTFESNQVHIVRASMLCGRVVEETVQCDCGNWEHVACVAAAKPRLLDPDTVHVCNECLCRDSRFQAFKQLGPEDDPYRATNLPHAGTPRATFITRELLAYLDVKGVKDRFVVIEACRTYTTHDMGAPMRSFLKALGATESASQIDMRFSVLLLVHLDDTLLRDTVVGAINLHEYLAGPAKGTAYVSYLDSLNHVPSSSRSPAIQGFFAMVTKSAAVLGSTSLKLYALSPSGTKYIWWERPQDMLLAQDPVVQQAHLVRWYVHTGIHE